MLYRFTLYLADLPEITDEMVDRLYEAGCDDGTPGSRSGVSFIGFSRDAASLDEAIRTAVRDVRRAGLPVVRAEIENGDLTELVDAAAAANS